MSKNEFLKKITSRKFIVTSIAVLAGIVIMFIGKTALVQSIAAPLMIVIPSIVYCLVEGKIDAKSIQNIADGAVQISKALGEGSTMEGIIRDVAELGTQLAGEDGIEIPKMIDISDDEKGGSDCDA